MEELISFMEDLLSITPPQGGQVPGRRELMMTRLSETMELLAEVASKHVDYGTTQFPRFY